MTADLHPGSPVEPEPTRRRRRAALAVTGVLALALVVAACGGGGGGPGVASAGSPTTTAATGGSSGGGNPSGSATHNQAQLLKYSQCMRAHGIADFPDPNGHGISIRATPGSDLNPNSSKFQTAQNVCQKLMPGALLTPAEKAAANAKALKYSQCMRSHGVSNFPDPNGQGVIHIQASSGSSLDPNSSQFQAAQKACKSLSHGFMTTIRASGAGPGPGAGSGSGSASAGQ